MNLGDLTWEEWARQDYRSTLEEEEMPSVYQPKKKQRKGSFKKYGAARKNNRVSLPMAIRNRGTPAGYYEIPVRQLIKVYCNTSTGLWDTNQSTGVPIGLTGYRGLGLSCTLDATRLSLGEGSYSVNMDVSVPGFTELQSVFDLCKISDIAVEMWWTHDMREMSPSNYGNFDMFYAEDPNNVDPPANVGTVLQYSKVIRYEGNGQKKSYYKMKPHIRAVAGSENFETGTSTTVGISQPSTYIQTSKPSVAHFGLRGFLDIPTGATSTTSQLNILVIQTRRYKISK